MDWDSHKIMKQRLQECIEYFQNKSTGEQYAFWIAREIWAMGGPEKGIFFYKGKRSFKKESSLFATVSPNKNTIEQYRDAEKLLTDYMDN